MLRWWTSKVLELANNVVREGQWILPPSSPALRNIFMALQLLHTDIMHSTKRNLKNRRECNWRENGSKHYLGKSMGRGKKADESFAYLPRCQYTHIPVVTAVRSRKNPRWFTCMRRYVRACPLDLASSFTIHLCLKSRCAHWISVLNVLPSSTVFIRAGWSWRAKKKMHTSNSR